jgi:ABC-2 type transport system ATP-binding protein
LTLELQHPLPCLPDELAPYRLALSANGTELTYTYDTQADRTGITALLADLAQAGIRFKDLHTSQSSLEEIFVGLLKERA